ncbi:MAG: hypothetical protein R2785_00485 [Flavobacteriaceae bacterium]
MVNKIDEADCKITFVLALKDEESYYLDPIEYSKTVKILNIINDKNIDNINILEGNEAVTLYGTYGKCGVIVLFSKNRKLKKTISNL